MENEAFACVVARRLRWPIILVGAAAGALSGLDLSLQRLDGLTLHAAWVVGALAGLFFLCAALDVRFQRAVDALNAQNRRQTQGLSFVSRICGLWLPPGERSLGVVGLLLLALVVAAGTIAHHLAAAALSFAGFFLVCLARIALSARGASMEQKAPAPAGVRRGRRSA